MSNKPQLIIDLDGVLLDTVSLINDFKQLLIDHGVKKETLQKFYDSYIPRHYASHTYYLLKNPVEVLSILNIREDKLQMKLIMAIDDFIDNMSQYVFQDALLFLEFFQENDLYLVSYGGTDWQTLKLRKTGLDKFFKKIFITDLKKKITAVQCILEENAGAISSFFFFDDRGKEITNMKLSFPEICSVLVFRPNGKYNTESCVPDHVITTMNEAFPLIS